MFGPRDDAEGDCWVTSGLPSDIKAPMGRYGCDSPKVLLETMLDEFNDSHGKQDVIFVTGDLSSHHTAMNVDRGPDDEDTYPLLMSTHAGLVDLLSEKFPDTLIIPAFGNNDCKFHDNPTPTEEEYFFNNYIYELWFDVIPGNDSWLNVQQKRTIYESFLKGGYYRVDLNDDLSVLALNTLYYDSIKSPSIMTAPRGEEQH